jgi:mersacidin/lichenicidin family type 2 lantibiotic
MRHLDIIRAWKDEEYRLSLSEAERDQLPAHPAGVIELAEEDLAGVGGGGSGSGGSGSQCRSVKILGSPPLQLRCHYRKEGSRCVTVYCSVYTP